MAFNWQTFRIRTATSLIFIAVMLGGLLINQWTFFLLFSVIHFGCWFEYQKLVQLIDKEYKVTPFHKYGVMLAGWCIMLYFTNDSYSLFGLKLHELGWRLGLFFIVTLPIMELLLARHIRVKNIGHSTFGLVYISLSLALMMDLRRYYSLAEVNIHYYSPPPWHSIVMPCVIIISLWINDTMAYLVGSLIGKTPLTKISPKKTWEGTIGGILLAIALMGVIAWRFEFNVKQVMIISAIASIAGTFGDILESKLKRMAGVKDTGTLLPGHGGFLDRFDSLLVAVPFVWLVYGLAFYFNNWF